jgi:hypothetical protein
MIAEELRQKDIATAAEVEAIISKVLSLEPDKEIVQELQSALSSYDSLTDTQKGFVKSDINLLKRLLDQSLELKNKYEEELKIQHDKEAAADAEREISDVISYVSSGTRENLDRLENAKREYDRLSYDERQYFDDSLISRLSSLISQAEDDKEAYDRHKREEEEAKAEEARKDRERRAMLNSSMHHDSDFGSIGSHSSGLGGMGSHSPSSFGGSHSTPTHTGFGGKSSGGGTKGKF